MHATLRQLLSAWWRPVAQRAARSYVAGPELSHALQECRRWWQWGVSSAIGYWNDERDSPRQTADAYLSCLDALARERLKSYLSVKAPALEFSRDLIVEVLQRARAAGICVHFDSLGPESAHSTFSLIGAVLPSYTNLGCTLPGRWRRSLHDTDRAVELGLRVRVVKGQWVDPSAPEIDPREGFLAVIDRLAGRARHVAVATHDSGLAQEALWRLSIAHTPSELELLFGLPLRRMVRVARTAGVPVRLYVPYGHASLPYNISHAHQDPRILWWLLQSLVLDSSSRRAVLFFSDSAVNGPQ